MIDDFLAAGHAGITQTYGYTNNEESSILYKITQVVKRTAVMLTYIQFSIFKLFTVAVTHRYAQKI